MTSMRRERSYNGVIANIEGKHKMNNSFKEKVGRNDRGNIQPTKDKRNEKAWIVDGTMYMNE